MARDRRTTLLAFARIWAYPLWCSVIRSEAADAVAQDGDWWMRCVNDEDLRALDRCSRFATDCLHVEDGVVRRIYARDTTASDTAEPETIRTLCHSRQ